jgi:hypothetical protein
VRRTLLLLGATLLLLAPLAACSDDDAQDADVEADDGDDGNDRSDEEDGSGDESTSTTELDGTTTTAGTTDSSDDVSTTQTSVPPGTDTTGPDGATDFCTAYDALDEKYAELESVTQPMVDDLRALIPLVPPEVGADIELGAAFLEQFVGMSAEEMVEAQIDEDPELEAAGERLDAYTEATCGPQD